MSKLQNVHWILVLLFLNLISLLFFSVFVSLGNFVLSSESHINANLNGPSVGCVGGCDGGSKPKRGPATPISVRTNGGKDDDYILLFLLFCWFSSLILGFSYLQDKQAPQQGIAILKFLPPQPSWCGVAFATFGCCCCCHGCCYHHHTWTCMQHAYAKGNHS